MKAIPLSHFKMKSTDLSRQLFIDNGWEIPKGLLDKKDRDPFNLSVSEWQFLEREGINPKQIKQICQDAWQQSDSLISFRQALEERGLFLAKGDKRGFVVLDEAGKVFSLLRVGGLKSKELKLRLGSPDQLDSVDQVQSKIRIAFNSQIRDKLRDFKAGQNAAMQELEEKKSQLICTQRAERIALADQQRVQRNILIESGRAKYRRGLRGLFDKITGRERRIRLINREELRRLIVKRSEARLQMIFRHVKDSMDLQQKILETMQEQIGERAAIARQLKHEFNAGRGARMMSAQKKPKHILQPK